MTPVWRVLDTLNRLLFFPAGTRFRAPDSTRRARISGAVLYMSDDNIRQMISYAIKSCRPHFFRLAQKHNKDAPAQLAATAILRHIRQSGYDVVRVKAPTEAHSTHSGRVSGDTIDRS